MAVLTIRDQFEDTDRETGGFSFGQEKSAGGRTIQLYNVSSPQDLFDTIAWVVGYTYVTVSDGRLTRLLPKADPQYPYLIADGIALQGKGQSVPVSVGAGAVLECDLLDDSYGLWKTYDGRVTFSAAPYAVLKDSQITMHSASWYESKFFDPSGAARPFFYADEWLRFCTLDRAPRDEYATGTIPGQQRFYVSGTPSAPGTESAATAEGKYDKRTIKQYLNNADVTLTWYGVPLRYVRSDNCYFDKYRGRVNQNTWETPWTLWQPGELLYQNYSYKEYVPPLAQIEVDPIFGTITSIDKLCTVAMKFIETRRPCSDTFAPSDLNIVKGGHNLQPWWRDRRFHFYATPPYEGAPVGTNPTPSFDSVDLRILFTDPDWAQPLYAGGPPI